MICVTVIHHSAGKRDLVMRARGGQMKSCKRDRDLTPSPYNARWPDGSMARRAESPVERAKRAVRANERSE